MPPPVLRYDEIELRVEREPSGYTVRASADGAEARAPFELPPLDRDRIENLVLHAIMPRRRRVDSGALDEVTALGTTLFESIVRGEVRDLYRAMSARADAAGHGLRIKLALTEAPEFSALPWELLYDEASFLVLDRTTPVVRSLDLPLLREVVDVEPPMKVLGIISSPHGLPALDGQQERRNVEKGLEDLSATGAVHLRWLERATLPLLVDALRADSYHVLHFIGHGAFDDEADDSVLLMEDDDGFARKVSSRRLGQILRGHDSLRLAVINACEGGRGAVDDPFAGIAASLLQQGVPAIVAMQFEITDRAAVLFSRDLYDALAHGYPVDAAVAEARKAIWADDNDVEWATPVLFMRARDGELFNVVQRPPERTPPEHTSREQSEQTPREQPEQTPRPRRVASMRISPRVRYAAAAVLLLVVIGGVLALRNRPGGWQRLPDLPVALEAAGVVAFDGRIWVVGGVSADEGRPKLSRVDIYDPGTRSWRAGPPLPVGIDHGSLVATNRQLFLLGGLAETGSVDTVYRLDAPNGEWRVDVPLPAPRGAGAAVWDGGRVVFAGGVGRDGRAADDVWALQEGQWRSLGRLQRAREKLAGTTDGFGTVWFLGGRDPNDQANAFPYVDVVQAGSVKPGGEVTAVQGPAGVWWPGAGACMIGGQSRGGFDGGVSCVSNATPAAPELKPGRAGLGAAVVARTLYVAGGYYTGVSGIRTLESLALPQPGAGPR